MRQPDDKPNIDKAILLTEMVATSIPHVRNELEAKVASRTYVRIIESYKQLYSTDTYEKLVMHHNHVTGQYGFVYADTLVNLMTEGEEFKPWED